MTLRERTYLVERRELVTAQTSKVFRKEFLTLMKNVKPLKAARDFERAVEFKKVMHEWSSRIEDYYTEIKRELKHLSDEDPHHYEMKRLVGEDPVWTFILAAGSAPPFRDKAHYKEYQSWVTDDEIFKREVDSEILKWDRKIRAKARDAWKWFDSVAELVASDSTGDRQVTFNTQEVENHNMLGFSIRLKGFNGTEFHHRMLKEFKGGLQMYKKRAAKVLPLLLRKGLPFVISFDGDHNDFAGSYNHSHVEFRAWGTIGKPRAVAHVIAHEMGHHIWHTFLSHKDQRVWMEMIHGKSEEIDLRDVLKSWEGKGRDYPEKSDSLRYLQLTVYNARSGNYLGSARSIQRYLDAGGSPVIRVTSRPVTAYGGSNYEEAFCEAVGLLVGYGPRTVLPIVKKTLRVIVPSLKVESSSVHSLRNQVIG